MRNEISRPDPILMIPNLVSENMINRGSIAAIEVLNSTQDIQLEDLIIAILNAALHSEGKVN